MNKHNVNIINFDLLYEILYEIKEKLSFTISKYENEKDFLDYNDKNYGDCLIISNSKKLNLIKKNLLVFDNLPLSINKLIELININFIRLKFNHQSKINIKGFELNLNSKFFSKNNIELKLTEKEIELILYLDSNKSKHSVLDLQKNIWGYASDLETHTVETHIYRLRKKIGDKFKDKNFIISSNEGYYI